MSLDLDRMQAQVEKDHQYRFVGIDEMYPECTCGESGPCQEKELVLALIEEARKVPSEGYAVVKIGEVPPWMVRATDVNLNIEHRDGGTFASLADEVYRLSPAS